MLPEVQGRDADDLAEAITDGPAAEAGVGASHPDGTVETVLPVRVESVERAQSPGRTAAFLVAGAGNHEEILARAQAPAVTCRKRRDVPVHVQHGYSGREVLRYELGGVTAAFDVDECQRGSHRARRS
jgi:hypothetical protein